MTNPEYLHWSDFEGRPLRCDLCGEQIGVIPDGGDLTPAMRAMVVCRCYFCAATEEAEAITREAS